MFKCLLVGAGQLGSRYLQGLAQVEQPLSVQVVEPSHSSVNLAQQRLADVQLSNKVDIQFHETIEYCSSDYDLAIIATPSHCRPDVVANVNSCCKINGWILEKILAQSASELRRIEQALKFSDRVWVNTPRRIMPWYESIKKELFSTSANLRSVRVSGGCWGLACNSIHFIDLVSWLSNSQVRSVSSSDLIKWSKSKRIGCYEVFGKLNVEFMNQTQLELICDESDSKLQIEIIASDENWLISESDGKAISSLGHEIVGELDYQSSLTAPLVHQILTTGYCRLPSLADSASQHRPLLDSLLKHWNNSQGITDLIVPIT